MKSRTTLKLSASALAVAVACGMSTAAYANEDVLRMQNLPDHVVMPSITYNGWNYSLLDQITLANVGDLTMVWTLALGITDEFEAPPLVVGNVMYIISPQDAAGLGPNEVLALDLTDEGRILWEFRPDVPDIAETRRVACCGDQTRGFHYAEGKLFMQTLDGQVFALDAGTGEALWRTQGVDLRVAETMTGTGGVFGNLYLTGNAGGEYGVRGKIAAYDINTGNLQYTMYNMGPDNEVGITPSYQAFYPDNQTSLATWYGDSWRRGGGTTWGYFTYDPDLSIFYFSTGNCGPWNPDYRREWGVINLDENGGMVDYRNNWCASQMARDLATGNLVWAYNITPADPWDLDEPLITPLIDLTIGGTMQHTAVKAARNGWFYVWDRATGELLIEPWMHTYNDITLGVDMDTGRAMYDIDKWTFTNVEDRRNYTQADPLRDALGANLPDNYTGTEVFYCPGTSARNWQNDAYSPRTGLLYTVVNTNCSRFRMIEGEYVPGQGWSLQQGAGTADRTWFDGEIITFQAQIQANNPLYNQDGAYQWPAAPGGTAWAITFEELTDAPIMATATDLLFTGDTTTGRFLAIDATNGDIAWAFRVGQSFQGTPITYIGPDGRQYVAVIGSGETTANVDPADGPNADERYWRAGSNLYVFALPQSVAGN